MRAVLYWQSAVVRAGCADRTCRAVLPVASARLHRALHSVIFSEPLTMMNSAPIPRHRLHILCTSLLFSLFAMLAAPAQAFCGFFVGKAGASLFNEASQVILTRKDDRTVISMANDYQGNLKEFALVVPVPTVMQKGQINVGSPSLFARIDAYSSPRLAEYYDENPCERQIMYRKNANAPLEMASAAAVEDAESLGVTVEAEYTVGEYDIVILSAKESDGLETWLTTNGYSIPAGASKALRPYVRQGMKFFVAKVNLKEQAKTGFTKLRPLQFAFEYERFMLPIRLGMINSRGPQDLIVYVLTEKGRVESSNYRTVKLPANMDLPVQVQNGFEDFYQAMFDRQAAKEKYKVVFTEYFWDMSWCDPCAADPLSRDELRQAGVWWLDDGALQPDPQRPGAMQKRVMPAGVQNVMLTRLHMRYTPDSFPEDLMFTETSDRRNFQTRYVIRHPYTGKAICPEAETYYRQLTERQEKEAQTLANLTGWDIQNIRSKIRKVQGQPALRPKKSWWSGLWGDADSE